MSSPTEFLNFIAGAWQPAIKQETFLSTNPARVSEIVARYPQSTIEDLEAAVQAAHKAQKSWAATPAPIRGDILFRAATLFEARKEELAVLMTREMGKILKETRGEVQTTVDVARFIAGEARRAEGATYPSGLQDKFTMTVRHPLGVVGIITPWNFPLSIPAWKTFPALIAGNAVVLKPASDTPALSLKMAEILHEAGLPAGLLNVITGPGSSLGDAMATHPLIKMISLTGSTEVGRRVGELCGRELKRCALELGGKNALIVMEDADLDLAAESILWGGFGTTGQRCTATSRVIVHRAVQQALTDRLVASAETLRIGDGLDEATAMGPLVNRGRIKAVHAYTEIGKQQGARLVTGGSPLEDDQYADGAFYRPTIFTDVTPEMRIAREEVFGPFLSLLPVASYEEAIAIANSTEYGLSTSLFTRNMRTVFRAIRDIEAGLTYINAPTTGAEIHLPFGGMKMSGNGHRELGEKAVAEFSEVKSVFVSYPQ